MNALKTLDKIAAVRSPMEKVRLIRVAIIETLEFRRILEYALNPHLRYFIRKLPAPRPPKKPTFKWGEGFRLLDSLAARRFTGSTAIGATRTLMMTMSAADQVVFQRILLKDLRAGINTKLVNTAIPGLIPDFNLQLAAPFDPKHIAYPIYGDIKYDGIRVVAICEGTSIAFLSRGGREITSLSPLAEAVSALLPREGGVLDGEAMAAGKFEDVVSAVKRKSAKEGAPARMIVFEYLTLEEWRNQKVTRSYIERKNDLETLFRGIHLTELKMADTHLLKSEADMVELFSRSRSAGFEGIILKSPFGGYEFKRTRDWMKVKASETIDAEITGVIEGEGKYAGRVGALTFNYNGVECRAGTGFSDDERADMWNWYKHRRSRRSALIGLTMEVEFTEATAKGRTRHARFVRLREYEGERS